MEVGPREWADAFVLLAEGGCGDPGGGVRPADLGDGQGLLVGHRPFEPAEAGGGRVDERAAAGRVTGEGAGAQPAERRVERRGGGADDEQAGVGALHERGLERFEQGRVAEVPRLVQQHERVGLAVRALALAGQDAQHAASVGREAHVPDLDSVGERGVLGVGAHDGEGDRRLLARHGAERHGRARDGHEVVQGD